MKKKILVVGGDLNSINSEIIFKSWPKFNESIKKRLYLISNYDVLSKQLKKLGYRINLVKVKNIHEKNNDLKLKVLNIDLKSNNIFKINENENSRFILRSLNLAHNLALNKKIAGIVNCAIDKKLLKKSNYGVTEYLASKCNIKDNSEVMLIHNKNLSVSPITTHLNLKDVAKKIQQKTIIQKLKTINIWYKKKFKKKPKIAVLGLNPHNGELKKNTEEKKIIIPALNKLKKFGLNLKGPEVADTIFINDYKKYDIIVGMYHDQVLAPFKTLYKFDAINITLGLKYTRVSPDHGVARNLILKKKSNPLSFIRCIQYLNSIY